MVLVRRIAVELVQELHHVRVSTRPTELVPRAIEAEHELLWLVWWLRIVEGARWTKRGLESRFERSGGFERPRRFE